MKEAKRFQIILTVIILFFLYCIPAESHAQEETRANSLEEGVWSLQFEITRDFTLGSFEGAVISAKHHFSDKRAVRFGFGVDIFLVDSERTASTVRDTFATSFTEDASHDRASMQLALQYLWYPNPDNNVNLFVGFGPLFGFSRSDIVSTRTVETLEPMQQRIEEDFEEWSLGITGSLGVEWFATKQISLLAEYGLSLAYRWLDRRVTSQTDNVRNEGRNDDSVFSINADRVRLGLSVYF